VGESDYETEYEEEIPGEVRKSFMGHLLELRARIFVCLFFILGATAASWVYWKEIARYLRLPIDAYNVAVPPERQVELIITGPMEAFTSVLYIGLWAGIVLASPIILWELWRFVAPGLYRRERFAILPILLLGPFLFATGAYFAFQVVLPIGFEYLLSFAPEIDVVVKLKLNEYMRFFLMIHVAFGFAFETPLIILLLAMFGFVTARGLLRASRYVIAVAFILGAVLTPPDVLTQSMMAGVLIVLYFLSVILAAIFGRKRRRAAAPAKVDDPHADAPPPPD